MADEKLGIDDSMFAEGNSSEALTPAAPEATPEPSPQPEPQTEPGQPRGADGKFAPKVEATPNSAPQQPADHKPKVDPEQFKGYLDERDKRKAAEDRATKAEQRARELEARQSEPSQIPSIQADPAGYQQWQETQLFQARIQERVTFSEILAKKEFGEDVVKAAEDWGRVRMQTVPGFYDRQIAEPHPIDWLVNQYKRHELMNEVGTDPDAYVRRRAAELGLTVAAPQTNEPQPVTAASPAPAPQTSSQPPPPRSLASAQSAGGMASVPMGEFAALDVVHKH